MNEIFNEEDRSMGKEKRAWSYCYINAPEDTHGSLKEQRRTLMDYAEQMGFSVAGCSEDVGAGLGLERPGLKRVTEAAKTGNIDVLLIHNISRIGRDTCRTMNYLEMLRQSGIAVYSPLEGRLDFSIQRFIGACFGVSDMKMQ